MNFRIFSHRRLIFNAGIFLQSFNYREQYATMPWWPFSVDFVRCAGWLEKSASETERCHCNRTWRISPQSIHTLIFVDDVQILWKYFLISVSFFQTAKLEQFNSKVKYIIQCNKCNVTRSICLSVTKSVVRISVNKLHCSVTITASVHKPFCIMVYALLSIKNVLLLK